MLTRRDLLKALAAAGVVGTTLPLGLQRLAFASSPSAQPVLIVLHLRGGCDGLNFISPSNDPDFIAARSSDLRVLADGNDAGFTLANGPAQGIDFRLHKAAGGLSEIYKSGNLAFIHAAGLTDATRSHFVANDMIENGVGNEAGLAHVQSGWLARVIEAAHDRSASGLQAIAVGGGIPGDLNGLDRVLAVPDANNGLSYVGGAPTAAALWQMYANFPGIVGNAGREALQLPTIIDQRIARDGQGHVLPYQAANGADYNASGGFGNSLRTVARLIRMEVGLQAVTLDYGGWDTHEYQPGRFNGLVGPLSNGLAAFWNDMAAYHDRIVLVTLTEFGRRLRSNKSSGTDHGRASVMTVMGGQVRGGQFFGKWPGLKSEQLDERVDLAVTTDYRQVLTEILNHMYGHENAGVFPDYRYSERLGLF